MRPATGPFQGSGGGPQSKVSWDGGKEEGDGRGG
jgi:hypothetical protein